MRFEEIANKFLAQNFATWQIEEPRTKDPTMSWTRKFDGLSFFLEVLGAKKGLFETL